MAIKSRLLSKLKFIYMTTTMAATAHPQKLRPVLHNLEEARELCQQGLTEINYAKYSEVYDGLIMAVKQILSGEAGKDAGEIVGLCKELLEHIMAETGKEEHFKKEMVFLPYKASMWDSLESVWRAAYEDKDNCLAYVIPIPYCDRNQDGTAKEWHCERDLFPKDVPTLYWQEVDLKAMHPDVIFFHYPYDDCNRVTSVEEIFYSRNIKPCTDKLVYIPYFVLGEPELDYDDPEKVEEVIAHFILEPGVFNADCTIVQSEAMKKVYVNVLTRHTNADREYWEEHILGLGSPKFDKVARSRKEDYELPEDWVKLIKGRKTILYNTGLTAMLEHTDKYLEKLKSVLETFKAQQDVVLWWRPHPLLMSTFQSMHPELIEEYEEIVDAYRQEGWGIYDDTVELERAVTMTDGYYGDASSVVRLYEKTGRPIMMQACDVDNNCRSQNLLVWSTAFCVEGNILWFMLGKANVLMKHDLGKGKTEAIGSIPQEKPVQEGMIASIQFYQGRLFLIPAWGKEIAVYDISESRFHKIHVPNPEKKKGLFLGGVTQGDMLYCIPFCYGKIVKLNMITLKIEKLIDIEEQMRDMGLSQPLRLNSFTCIDNGKVLAIGWSDKVLSFDMCGETVQCVNFDDDGNKYSMIAHIGKYVFLGGYQVNTILRIDCETQEKKRIALPVDASYVRDFNDRFILIDNTGNGTFALIDVDGQVVHQMTESAREKRSSWQYSYQSVLARQHGNYVYICDTARCKWYEIAVEEFKEIRLELPSDCSLEETDWTSTGEAYQEFPVVCSLTRFLGYCKWQEERNGNDVGRVYVGSLIMDKILQGIG